MSLPCALCPAPRAKFLIWRNMESSNNNNNKSRREFLGNVLRTGSFAAMGGFVGIGLSRDACGLSSVSKSDLSSLVHIDPKLILYKEGDESIPTGMSEARALSVDASGILYVAGDHSIKVIDPGGSLKDTLALTVAPRCLAPAENKFYIGTRDHIVVVDRSGAVQAAWPSLGENALITNIALDDEHVYIADAGQRIVWCFDHNGQFVRRIGNKNPEKDIPGFVVPSPFFDLAMGDDGLLWVANPGRHQVEAYTARGDREFAWGKFGNNLDDFTACCNPMNFAILSDGGFVTVEKGIVRIKVYDAKGLLTGVVAGPEQLIGGAWSISETEDQRKHVRFDVAADAAGHVYVLDRGRSVVRIFTRKEG
jgi:hypothetical protein